jgi:UDP-2,3-diacylglucosamine pyrophosphatase LpxH
MKLDEVHTWFLTKLPFSWLIQDFSPKRYFQIIRPPHGQQIDIAPLEAAIVIPDVHLGWGNDVFRFNDPDRERRLEDFLDVLAEFREDQAGKVELVQVGDWYDFWRSPGFTHSQAKAIIESQYPGVVSRARRYGLRHCIGNHDAAFAERDIRNGIDAEIVRTIGEGHRVLCLHGHDTKTLESIAVDGTAETIGLNILNLFNSGVPLLGLLGSIVQRVVDDSSEDPWSDDPRSLPWPKARVPGPSGWAAPWVARDGVTQLGAAISGFELCVKQEVEVVLLGHSHRPGISWSPVAGRRVPVVDVGSWTYGRTEFAVVCPDGIGIARLDDAT